MKPIKQDSCELCKREVELSFHHFIPKKMHGKRAYRLKFDKDFLDHHGCWVCNDCHKMIHRTLDHQQLAEHYNTLEHIMDHPEISKFIQWVGKQKKRVKR